MIHAAGESSPGNLPEGTHAIALVVADEAALWRLNEALQRANVQRTAIIEADGPYTGQLLAIGVSPRRKEELKKHLSSYALLK